MGIRAGRGGPAAFDPVALEEACKRFWGGFWQATLDEAVIEHRMDRVKFGPLLALLTASCPENPAVNFVVGAGMPGALEGGHLEDGAGLARIAWHRFPRARDFRPAGGGGGGGVAGGKGPEAARGTGCADAGRLGAAVLRSGASRRVRAHRPEESEAFGDSFVESLDLAYWMVTTFMVLSDVEEEAAEGWRCYSAVDGHDHEAYAVMSIDSDVAMLALASYPHESGDGDGQAAVLHRCIAEAAAAGCKALAVADTGQDLAKADRESLTRAGFEEAFSCSTWRPRVRVPT
jgi:hypothetical protein